MSVRDRNHWPGAMVLSVAIALSMTGSLSAQPKREFAPEEEVDTYSTWRHFPTWNAGLLFGYENNDTDGPIVYTIDKKRRRDEFLLAVPDAKQIGIRDLTVGPNGEIAVAAVALAPDGRATTFIARLPPDRGSWRVTRTFPYSPWAITITSRGDVWTIDSLHDEDSLRFLAESVLRRYDPSGKLLESQPVAARRGWTAKDARGVHPAVDSFLFSSPDRVGWLSAAGEYVEFSLDGAEIGRYQGPMGSDRPSGVAISADNDVVLSAGRGRFLILDRSSGEWTRVFLPDGQAPSWARVLGFDGTTLVTTTGTGKLTRYTTK